MITFLWAEASNHVIGKDGKLPWHLPDDLHYFRAMTVNQLVVFGRTTYEGLPKRPLPDRVNIVMTRNADYEAPGAIVSNNKQVVLDIAAKNPDKQLVVVGGAKIFALFADIVDTLLVTRIAGTIEGDTVMTPIDWSLFKKTSERFVENENSDLNHTFEKWERR